jgi:outer membrane immunogenic protein
MKRLAVATLIAVGQAATTSINAADLPPSEPPSAPAQVLTTPYSWTGFYLGGHAGGARVEDRATAVSTSPLIISSTIDSVTSNSFLIGGQVGFNYQVGIAVVGVEADGSWTNTTESTGVQPLGPGGTVNTTRNISWYGTATVRAGAAWDNVLLYAKAGAAGMNARYTSDIQENGVAKRQGVSDRRLGWTAGGGIEVGFYGGWSGKVEYAYLDFGTSAYWLAFPAADPWRHVHMVKARINKRFGEPDSAGFSQEGAAHLDQPASSFYDPTGSSCAAACRAISSDWKRAPSGWPANWFFHDCSRSSGCPTSSRPGSSLEGSSIWPEGRASLMPIYCGPRIGRSACSVKCLPESRFTTETCSVSTRCTMHSAVGHSGMSDSMSDTAWIRIGG